MRYLVDTHLLLWAGLSPDRLSATARKILDDRNHEIFFSTVSIWETAIKFGLRKADFGMPPVALRRGLLSRGYSELSITSDHAIEVANLPPHHGDPFDRILVAQAITENMLLLTADKTLTRYPNTLRV